MSTFLPLLGCDQNRLFFNKATFVDGAQISLFWPSLPTCGGQSPAMRMDFILLCLCAELVNLTCNDAEATLDYFASVRIFQRRKGKWRLQRVIEIFDDAPPLFNTDPEFGLPRTGLTCANDLVVFADITDFIEHVTTIPDPGGE
jgi:hypothetical protein